MLNKGFTKVTDEASYAKSVADLDQFQKEAVESTAENVVLRAPAGSGKTKSIIAAIAAYRYENLNDRICAITYTRAARAEMEARLQELGVYDAEVTTIHVWSRNILQNLSLKYGFKITILEENEIKSILQEIVDEYIKYSKVKRINIGILYTYITGNKNMDITDNYRRTLNALENRYINYKRDNGLYDFTDYPLYLFNILETYDETINDIDALFVDEFQDVDETQLEIFKKVNTKKKFYVGDAGQCQPAGTKILIRDKNGPIEKNIEDIQIGDPIVYYDQAKGYVSGCKLPHNAIIKKVINKQVHDYQDRNLITITSESGLQSSYTENHRTFIRLNYTPNKHVVYLMCDKNYRFRIGKVPLFFTGKTDKSYNPWRSKMIDEGCEKIWLLDILDSDHDARVLENKLSYYYRIPQICWQQDKVSWTAEDIDYIYEGLNTFYSAMMCLQHYHLSIEYPLLDLSIDWMRKNHYTTNASSEIYAINLRPEIMSCLVYGSETSHKNLHAEKILKVQRTLIQDPIKVYALEVEDGTYVADRIITHNSIFQFRGADGFVFTKLDNFEEYKLKCNYRSYQEIIDYAATVYIKLKSKAELNEDCYISEVMYSHESGIACNRGYGGSVGVINPYGRVYRNGDWRFGSGVAHIFSEFMQLKPMILCRTNKQVKAVQELGYYEVSTVHQAKGLEYPNVLVIDHTIDDTEDLNIAYVAMTRAENNLLVINWQQFEQLLMMYMNKNKFLFGGF